MTGRRSRRHVARFALVGLYTGRRAAAIAAASVHREIGRGYIDLERGTFEPARSRRTKKRQTPIRIPERLMAHIRRWARLGLCKRAVVEFNGQPIRRVSKAFASAARDAGLADATPHTLRHTAVTWAMQGGADLWDAAAMFSMTVETLERVYGHHRPGAGASVARALQSKAAG
jgi:integrase